MNLDYELRSSVCFSDLDDVQCPRPALAGIESLDLESTLLLSSHCHVDTQSEGLLLTETPLRWNRATIHSGRLIRSLHAWIDEKHHG